MNKKHSSGELARAWIDLQYARADPDAHERLFWAYTEIDHLMATNPEMVWVVIQSIVELDRSDLILSNLGAGPLEDLLTYCGSEFVDRVVQKAKQDSTFGRLVKYVWRNDMSSDIWDRLQSAANSG